MHISSHILSSFTCTSGNYTYYSYSKELLYKQLRRSLQVEYRISLNTMMPNWWFSTFLLKLPLWLVVRAASLFQSHTAPLRATQAWQKSFLQEHGCWRLDRWSLMAPSNPNHPVDRHNLSFICTLKLWTSYLHIPRECLLSFLCYPYQILCCFYFLCIMKSKAFSSLHHLVAFLLLLPVSHIVLCFTSPAYSPVEVKLVWKYTC